MIFQYKCNLVQFRRIYLLAKYLSIEQTTNAFSTIADNSTGDSYNEFWFM